MIESALQEDKLQALLVEVRNLERQHAFKRRSRKVAHHLQPLITFVERYALAVDVVVQGSPPPATLIWGLLRGLLVVVQSYARYFDRVVSMLERLGFIVSIYSQYEDIIGNSPAFKKCLCNVYSEIIEFLEKSKKIFQRSGFTIFALSIWRDFETEFDHTLKELSIHTEALRDQATLAYRTELYKSVRAQTHTTSEILNALGIEPKADERESILRWFAPIPAHRFLAREAAKKLCRSGEWLWATAEFDNWRAISPGLLWINAPPGTGKTILSTCIIEELSRTLPSSDSLCYFFCDKNDPSSCTLQSVLSTFLFQLFEVSRPITPSIVSAYSRARRFGYAKMTEGDNQYELFEQALLSIGRVLIVLDGIDESPDTREIAETLSKLVQSSQNCSVVILSRDVPIVRNCLFVSSELRMTTAHTQLDLNAFISQAVNRLALGESDPELERQIRTTLQIGSGGMFLWASLMIQSLQSTTTSEEAHDALSRMPMGLSGLYRSDLLRLVSKGPQYCEIFIHASRWLLCSLCRLSSTELRTAIAIDLTHPSFNAARKPFWDLVRDILSPFFVFDSTDDILRPAHPSVVDFFLAPPSVTSCDGTLGQFHIDDEHSHRLIAQECLLLLNTALSLDHIVNEAINETLTRYACLYWPEHIIKSTFDDSAQRSVMNFLASDCRRQWISYFLIWQRSVFPLQKLLYFQTRVQIWLRLAPDTDMERYLDWASDVATILLDLSQTDPNSKPQGHPGAGFGSATGTEALSHFERMMVLRDLSRHLTTTNRLLYVIDLFEGALREGQGDQNVSPRETAWLLNVLGILFDQQNRIDKATQTQEEALSVLSREGYYGSSEFIWTKNELGRMYRHQGRLEEAVEMHTAALAVLEHNTLDQTIDLEIAWTLSTVARVYRKQRRLDEAILHTRQALEIRRLSLGSSHPHYLWLLGDIAQCYYEMGDYDTAVRYHRNAYEGRLRTLGSEHLDTLWTMNNLAVVLAKLHAEHKVEALQLQKRAWEFQCRIFGREHPYTKWTEAAVNSFAELA